MKYALKGKYPIETKDQLEKTASYFDRYLSRFHPRDRVMFSATLEKRATDLHTSLDYDWIKNYSRAMNSQTVSPDFNRNMDLRKHACINKKIKVNGKEVEANALIDKIKEASEKQSPYTTVDAIFSFDKLAGLEYQWDRAILDPVMTVFGSLRNPNFDIQPIIGNMTKNDLQKIASNLSSELTEQAKSIARFFDKKAKKSFIAHPVETVQGLSSMEKESFLKIIEK